MEKTWFTVKQVLPNIWGIGEFLHEEEVISYLVVGENKCLLFDSGLGIGDINSVVKKITKLPIELLNSHSHYDHVGGNKHFNKISKPKNGSLIFVEPFNFMVFKTPGHTPDSICLYEVNKKILFSGDTLYPGPIYLHLPESNIKVYQKSLIKLNKLDIKIILPAHNKFRMNPKLILKIINALKDSDKKQNIKIDKATSLKIKG